MLVLAGLGVWIGTSSWFIVWQMRPELERRLGGEVTIGRAGFEWAGNLVVEDVVLRSPQHEGTAGEIASIGRAVISVDTDRLWSGKTHVLAIDLYDVLLRIAEDATEPNHFTFDALETDWTDADPGRTRPPRIEIHKAILEYGTYVGLQYEMKGQRRVAGVMHPAIDDTSDGHWYNFLLGEIHPVGPEQDEGLVIRGRWNAASHQYVARMDGFELNEATYNMCPQVVRTWWDQMELQGRVSHAVVQWESDAGLDVTSEILDVSLRLPVQPGEWSRYHEGRIIGESGRPVMRVHSGTIRLRDNELLLDEMEGELKGPDDSAGVPYIVSMRLPELPDMNWQQGGDRDGFVEHVRDFTPFEVQFQLENFRIEPDEHGRVNAVDLPQPVAEMLQRFSISDWTISTTIQVSRKPAGPQGRRQIQPIEISGDLAIRDASGSFDRFPYPLHGVEAYLTFTQDGVDVEYVMGTGTNGSQIHVSGEIAPLGRNPRIDLRLVSKNAPVDELLREALPEVHTAVFDGLLHEPSAAAMQKAGLLIDEKKLADLHRQRDELAAQLADDPMDEVISRQLAQVDAQIEAGVFELGGIVDLDVRILREVGPNQKTQLSGEIAIQRLDAIIRYFPYPFSIRGGVVRWGPDGAELVGKDGEGLPVVTQGGGRGAISGRFLREQRDDESDYITPQVRIVVNDDSVNDLVYASIPGSERGDSDGDSLLLSQPAMLLRAVGLDGPMNYQGFIGRDAQGDITYEFDIYLVSGTATPSGALVEAIGSAGLAWPMTWIWDDVNLHVRVSSQAVELIEFNGKRDGGGVTAAGVLDIRPGGSDASLDVRLTDLAIDRYLLDLVPQDRAARASELWDEYAPDGVFNARLQFHRRGDKVHPPRLFLEPVRVSAMIGDERVNISYRSGALSVLENRVDFADLILELSREGVSDGRLVVDGRVSTTRDRDVQVQVQAQWVGGRFESPLVEELLELVGAAEYAKHIRTYDPAGMFDAHLLFTDSGERENREPYEVLILPKSLAASVEGERLSVLFDESSRVRFVPGRVALEQVSGRHDGGTFRVRGDIRMDEGIEAHLHFDHVGALSGSFAQRLFPQQFRSVLKQFKYNDGPGTRVEGARLRVARGAGSANQPWHVDFQGKLQTDRASLDADIDVKEIDGVFDIVVKVDPDETTIVAIDAQIDHMRVFGRELRNVIAPGIALSEDGRSFVLPSVRGDAYGGAVWAEASIGVGDNLAYTANASFVGVSLQAMLGDTPDARPASRQTRGPRGELFGGVQLSGLRGQTESRSGRGSARAIGSGLANVPFVLQLVQLIQLTVPLRGDMDHADVVFFIDGDRAVFERILLESTIGSAAALQFIGNGELNLRNFELSTQFRSRSGMLLIRELVGGLSDQLYLIEVTGTLANPRARVVPLPGLQPDRSRPHPSAAVLQEPTR